MFMKCFQFIHQVELWFIGMIGGCGVQKENMCVFQVCWLNFIRNLVFYCDFLGFLIFWKFVWIIQTCWRVLRIKKTTVQINFLKNKWISPYIARIPQSTGYQIKPRFLIFRTSETEILNWLFMDTKLWFHKWPLKWNVIKISKSIKHKTISNFQHNLICSIQLIIISH